MVKKPAEECRSFFQYVATRCKEATDKNNTPEARRAKLMILIFAILIFFALSVGILSISIPNTTAPSIADEVRRELQEEGALREFGRELDKLDASLEADRKLLEHELYGTPVDD